MLMSSKVTILRGLGFTPSEVKVLLVLDGEDNFVSTSQLREKSNLEASPTSKAVKHLEELGIITAQRPYGTAIKAQKLIVPLRKIAEDAIQVEQMVPSNIGLCKSQSSILRYLSKAPPYVTTKDVMDGTGLNRPAVCWATKKLIAQKIVTADQRDSSCGGRPWKTYKLSVSLKKVGENFIQGL